MKSRPLHPAFAKLKPLGRSLKRERLQSRVTARPAAPQPDDAALFRQAMQGVVPLTHDYVSHPPQPPSPHPRQHDASLELDATEGLTDFWPWDELASGEALLHLRPGMKTDTVRKLRRGDWALAGELDLHGLASDEARVRVALFLRQMQQARQCCVRIIHGKGLGSPQGPVLKLKLKNWLAQRAEVLAFCEASPHAGGAGAVLVLLKGRRA